MPHPVARVLAILLVVFVVAPGAASEPTRASCVLALGPGPSGTQKLIEIGTVGTMLTSTALVDPVVDETLGMSGTEWPKVVQVEVLPSGNAAIKLVVTIVPDDSTSLPGDAASKLVHALADRAVAAVQALMDETIRAAQARLDEHQTRREDLDAQANVLRAQLDAATNMPPSNTESIRSQLRQQLDAAKGRHIAVLDGLARHGERDNEMEAAFEALLDARVRLVAQLEAGMSEGRATALELASAQADLAEARIQVMQARRDRTQSWRDEAMSLEVTIKELEYRLGQLPPPPEAPAATPRDAQSLRADVNRLEHEIRQLDSSVTRIRTDRDRWVGVPGLVLLDGR